MRIARLQWLCARGQIIVGRERLPSILVCVLGESLARIIHQLVGWDKETAIWWAGACELSIPLRLHVVLGEIAVSAGPPRAYARWSHPT